MRWWTSGRLTSRTWRFHATRSGRLISDRKAPHAPLDDQFSSHRRMHQAGVGEGAALRRRTVTVNDSPESMLGVLTSRPLIEKQCRTRLGSSLRGDDLCYLRNRF
jgi:hypothetical protein